MATPRKPSKTPAASRAKAYRPTPLPDLPPPTVEARVELIADIMARGEWRTRVTARALAERWAPHGVGFKVIEDYATAASKRVRSSQGSRRAVVIGTIAKLELCYEDAMRRGQTRAAIAALAEITKIVGPLHPPARRLPKDAAPAGLPPELARLAPPPSPEEIDHFATTAGPGVCALDGCRVHPRPDATGEPGLH